MRESDRPEIWGLIDAAQTFELLGHTDSGHVYGVKRRMYVGWLIEACRNAAGAVDNDGNHVIKSYAMMRAHHERIMAHHAVASHPALVLSALLTLWLPFAMREHIRTDAAAAIRELSWYTGMLASCAAAVRKIRVVDWFPVTSVEHMVFTDGLIDALSLMYRPAISITTGGTVNSSIVEGIIRDILAARDTDGAGWMMEACEKADTLFWLLSSHP